jgi:signal peptidase II
MQPMMPPKGRAYLAVLVPLLLLDRATKVIAVAQLVVATPQPVIGNTLRFTLVYNRNAAMDITLGPWSRWGFAAIAVVGVIVMLRWLRAARPGDWLRTAALGAVSAGAIGNLIDRLLSSRGVIDFIDIGIGTHRFWIFNVADMGVTIGAVLLALVVGRDDRGVGT